MADVPRWYDPDLYGDQADAAAADRRPALALLVCRDATGRIESGSASGGRRSRSSRWPRFPAVCDVIAGGPAFSGMRHFLFTVPPIAGWRAWTLTACSLVGRATPAGRSLRWRSSLVDLGRNATTLYRLHPDEYLYFNPLVGGLAGPRAATRPTTGSTSCRKPSPISSIFSTGPRRRPRPGRGIATWSRSAASACRSRKRRRPLAMDPRLRAAPSFSSPPRT